ncbi:MAG: transposase [Chloroflexales bacterium]|nr:transposase [Chloroflexales bacterium]
MRPSVTEYQYLTVCCRGCGELVTATRAHDVPPGAFGPRVVALIALLHGRYRISDRELVVLLQMVWALPISLGSVVNLRQEAVTSAEHANVDETIWREGSKKPWLWVAVASVVVLFRIQYGRGRAQLALLLGAEEQTQRRDHVPSSLSERSLKPAGWCYTGWYETQLQNGGLRSDAGRAGAAG